MSKSYYKWQTLCEKYKTKSSYSLQMTVEEAHQQTLRAALSLVVLATFAHRTKLEAGHAKVSFAENFSLVAEEELTAEDILKALASQLVSLRVEKDKTFASMRGISGSCGCVVTDETKAIFEAFLADPMASMPDELKDEVLTGLEKKAKSINKRLRNYDNEIARRKRGRQSRAVTSLTKVLAELDPEYRELAVRAIRHNRTTKGKYGVEDRSLMKLLNALNTICSGNNLENWQDEEVIPEAERLASVHWVMNQ